MSITQTNIKPGLLHSSDFGPICPLLEEMVLRVLSSPTFLFCWPNEGGTQPLPYVSAEMLLFLSFLLCHIMVRHFGQKVHFCVDGYRGQVQAEKGTSIAIRHIRTRRRVRAVSRSRREKLFRTDMFHYVLTLWFLSRKKRSLVGVWRWLNYMI